MALSAPGRPFTLEVKPYDHSQLSRPVATGGFAPTAEQVAIMDSYRAGKDIVVEALAGTGKTTTLKSIASMGPTRQGIYLAFNKTIVKAAASSFPAAVQVTTAHSLAYRAVGTTYAHRLPGNGSPRMPARRMAAILKVKPTNAGGMPLNPVLQTRLAQATVMKWMKTDKQVMDISDLPNKVSHLLEHGGVKIEDIWAVIQPIAEKIWQDLASPSGEFFFSHDVYLKLWQLTNPVLPTSYIMFDEAQDADPVIASIVAAQNHTQRIYVGDQNQAIYGWRGAVDAMGKVEAANRHPLTKSFRFGPAIAEQANLWLARLGTPLRVVGHEPVHSTVNEIGQPRAILCRTNGTALGWVLAFQDANIPVALAPGDDTAGRDILKFAYAARDLQRGDGTDHPDLAAFQTWAELVEYVEEEEDAADLKRLVGIINRMGTGKVISAIRKLVLEEEAVVTVSTAHKAKGLEWDTVRVADDFAVPMDEEGEVKEIEPADLMLAYVTVTRAKLQLDPAGLADPRWDA